MWTSQGSERASSPRARSVMVGNRSRDTKPELAVRRAVHARGLRYRVSARPLSRVRRTADLVFPSEKVAVFVDGCFWHGCEQHYVPSKTRAQWWAIKIDRNRERDEETDRLLRDAGWVPLRVWEHEPPALAASRVEQLVRTRRKPA
ncbi:very short patch repair endonuclease [Blastococcus haudaquaticus]|uniref:very short patch repair endonuclease n=1 Tax=Blastococcus haudaquaticus TaxID=1938745 RepID=UPI000BE3254D|nr:very short patch repair endonuclease [Blastococcus haudaquaticus]